MVSFSLWASSRASTYLAISTLCFASLSAQAGETTNKISIKMVNIPAGSFVMGSCPQDKKSAFLGESSCANPDPDASQDETPQHRVSVSAFKIGKTEVTLGQFKAFIKATGRSGIIDDNFMSFNAYGDNAPVVMVSWNDAQDFINWLNEIAGGGYRLPSEAEWEYACRAGGNHMYCGSNNLSAVAWYGAVQKTVGIDSSEKHQSPVGGKQANAWGLYDMSGNVWEWVQDCWHDSYNGAPSDGSAWTSGKCDWRGLRGGSWLNIASSSRAACRSKITPDFRNGFYGFRLARTR